MMHAHLSARTSDGGDSVAHHGGLLHFPDEMNLPTHLIPGMVVDASIPPLMSLFCHAQLGLIIDHSRAAVWRLLLNSEMILYRTYGGHLAIRIDEWPDRQTAPIL